MCCQTKCANRTSQLKLTKSPFLEQLPPNFAKIPLIGDLKLLCIEFDDNALLPQYLYKAGFHDHFKYKVTTTLKYSKYF